MIFDLYVMKNYIGNEIPKIKPAIQITQSKAMLHSLGQSPKLKGLQNQKECALIGPERRRVLKAFVQTKNGI